ncbi:MAG: hypothetical protein JW774_07995, partial [Candidatus Aureabacteria bacterium]|nr:hypothetical protein [Candidatus Auribacterota bacterium]
EHPLLLKMLKASRIEISENPPQSPMPSEVTPIATVSMELDKSLIDFDSERTKLSAKIENLSSFITTLSRKLSNPGFLSKASPEAVNNEKSKHTQAQEELQKLKTVFQFFK